MKHLFYAPGIAVNPELPEEESQHCMRVLRLGEGEEITLTDGKGFLYQAVLTETHPKHCRIRVTKKWEQAPLWNFYLHIAVAPTKNMERMEWFVEKATEIGINEITCLRCDHSERREIKLPRLNKIAVNAMKQSQKTILPLINEMIDFRDFVSSAFTEGYKMIGHCREGQKQLIKEVYKPGRNALLLIGPEGDFSNEEVQAASDAGFSPVSLGESRLRTETAALVACHTIQVLNQ
jgi:16S rRNA (uracil1498-N3)-methyltransferase